MQDSQKSIYRVVVVYQNDRRMMIIDPSYSQEVLPKIQALFNLPFKFKVMLKSLNAEVFATYEVFEGDELLIIPIEENNQSRIEERKELSEEIAITKVGLDCLFKKKFEGKNLLKDLNNWANPLGFTLIFPNGVTRQQDKMKRTVWCSAKDCKFKLYLVAELESDKSYDDLKFTLENGKDEHNHKLEVSEEDLLSPDIIKEIDDFKGKMKTKVELQNYINKKFKKNFTYSQISHYVTKLLNENFGKPDQDAYKLLEEIQKDVGKNGGNFCLIWKNPIRL